MAWIEDLAKGVLPSPSGYGIEALDLSYTQPRPFRHRIAAFIIVEKIEDRLDWFSAQSIFNNKLLQPGRAIIAPARFCHEPIPHDALLVSARRAMRVRPSEYVLVRSALKSARHKRLVFDPKKPATPSIVEFRLCVAKVDLVLGRKFAHRVQSNLVEHAAKIDQAGRPSRTGAKTGNMRHLKYCDLGQAPCNRKSSRRKMFLKTLAC
jgi:hypothetical protein